VVHNTIGGKSTWKRLGIIGAGASGEIWLEEEQKSGELRAVKQLRRRLKSDHFTRELLAFVDLREVSVLKESIYRYQGQREVIALFSIPT
jgi:hypothetical protein